MKENSFEKTFVISLPQNRDRLEKFYSQVPGIFGNVELYPAINGHIVKPPGWWRPGGGAWGCYKSHLNILERCYCEGVRSYLVFEDDALFREDAAERFERFMESVPNDWQQLYFGGELLHQHHRPELIRDGVYRPYNVNRTHCFAVHQRGYEVIYQHLTMQRFHPNEHIDHHLGRLHEQKKVAVYVPDEWIVGQDIGKSMIARDTVNGIKFFKNPITVANGPRNLTRYLPTIFLDAPAEVAFELDRYGWHRGNWLTNTRLDRGLDAAVNSQKITEGVNKWFGHVYPEAVNEEKLCVCIYHPKITFESLQSIQFTKIHRIQAKTHLDAIEQFNAILEAHSGEQQEIPKRRRNLIYHVFPRKGNGVWRKNISELVKRIEQFDGVRSVGIVTDDSTDSADDVRAAFGEHRIDNWIIRPNDRDLAEAVTFVPLLETLPHDDSITFRAHAKGVKYDDPDKVKDWSAAMYETCLDHPEWIDSTLAALPVCGPFKNTTEYVGKMKFGWHYSGTFFWFRNADVFSRDWRSVPQEYYGAEKWIGNLFTIAEAGDLFGGNMGWLYHRKEAVKISEKVRLWRERQKQHINFQQKFPIYVNARNLLTPLKPMIDYLTRLSGAIPIIVDNDSTWAPLLEYYEKDCPVQVIRTGVNGGTFGWTEHMLDHRKLGINYYVVTDPDLNLTGIPIDVLHVLRDAIDCNRDVKKVGVSLDLNMIPADYPFADEVKKHEMHFWRKKRGHFFEAGIAETFSMRRASDAVDRKTYGHLRADRPYCAIHWPWGWTPEVVQASEEIQYYIETSKNGHWTDKMRKAFSLLVR